MRVSRTKRMSKTYPVSGSSVLLGSLAAYDLQSPVAEGSRATLSNTGTIELAMDIYSKFAKSNSVVA